MREIEFRGKRIDNGEWVKGDFVDQGLQTELKAIFNKTEEMICPYLVKPETIGQYTGLCDKNGTKIFEGDVVKLFRIDITNGGIELCAKCEIVYSEDCFFCKSNKTEYSLMPYVRYKQIEVIGNIYDNPELLEEQQ